jgi:nitroimidazol reductase NimA-like FMN-containing flavoprotein (pyridoxamine 5'-phosphate oxidase superfamily)
MVRALRRLDGPSRCGTNVTQITNDRRDAGDVGRRIAERQDKLNLTIAQVAERAGMATDYLDYLEDTPTAEPSSSALVRIALALEMCVSDLLGGEQGRAGGRADAAPDPHLVNLDEKECGAYLAGGGVGRVIFRSAGRPVALPVNFKTLAGDVIFRSAENGEFSTIAPEEPVSFEVDHIDDAMREGWSVLATGTVRPLLADDQIDEVKALGIEPWAGGERHTYFRLSVTNLTGKKINAVR